MLLCSHNVSSDRIDCLSLNRIIFISLVFFLAISCNKNEQPGKNAVAATLYDYTGLDGCSWVIKLENGEVLEPTNLSEFNMDIKEGKKIWVTYSPSAQQVSICMVGLKVGINGLWDR